jgi:acyl-CoA hydrolase
MIAPINGRPVQESRSVYTYVALPNDANPLGNVLGGRVMHLVDMCGGIAALRHARPRSLHHDLPKFVPFHSVRHGMRAKFETTNPGRDAASLKRHPAIEVM